MTAQASINTDDVAALFYKDVMKHDLLTREEELALFKRYRKYNDQQAKDRIILSNLRFVIQEARRFPAALTANLMDIIEDGIIGLMRALERFDLKKKVHFITYAVWWIRQAIFESLNRTYSFIRLPNNILNRLRNDRFEEEFKNDDRRRARFYLIRNNFLQPVHYNAKFRDDADNDEYLSFIPASSESTPENVAEKGFIRAGVNRLLSSLSDKEKTVLQMRFGIGGHPRKSLREIADFFHLTKERIRQIQKKGLSRLKGLSRIEEYRTLLSSN
jgi:RNA polymerase primary sigma factor